jgi:type IV secretory pathway component VirB8
MEQNFEETKQEDLEQAKEYHEFIKASVEDGSYFKDALDWYFFRYLTPICDRTLLIFGAMVAAVVLFSLFTMIEGAFPLVQHIPVFIKSKDQSLYFPNLVSLKPRQDKPGYDRDIKTVDEAVAKYLSAFYVKDREGFDYSAAEIEMVNNKFTRMRNLSSLDEYKNFQVIMSKYSPDSPINKFGQNIKKIITIESVKLIKAQSKNFTDQAMDLILVQLPKESEVRFTATVRTRTDDGIKEEKESYVAKLNFDFDGINKDEKANSLNFVVTSYKLFKR